jgi:hypothetical protein
MILPRIRASFDRKDAVSLVELLGRDDPGLRDAARARLDEEGLDALLDDPRILNALLTAEEVPVGPSLVFYVLVRQSLLEAGVRDPVIADFLATLVLAFGSGNRAYRISEESPEEFHYLVDLVGRMGQAGADSQDAFLLRSHMGNYALWLTGLFPDFVQSRVRRRGAPPIRYYEQMGSSGYRAAAGTIQARSLGVEELFLGAARDFARMRTALNRLSDRHMWKGRGDPVGRLLREVTHGFPEA